MMQSENTNQQILKIARELLASGGLASLSFDAIAKRLGRTKQAVLYWFPSKHDLLAALFLPCLQAEAEAAMRSVCDTTTRDDTIEAFVTAITRFHLEDLDRFRMMYLLPQTLKPNAGEPHNADLLAKVHPVTDGMYSALADRIGGDPIAARREALAMHSAALGLVLMLGLADSIRDTLKHTAAELIGALVSALKSR
jgi:AcrR family transcriptional regulator